MIKIKDEDNSKEFLRIIRELNTRKIKIGIFGEDDSKILMIAIVNEFGIKIKVTDKMRNYLAATGLPLKSSTKYINIPERPFVRGAFDKNKKDIYKEVENDLDQLFHFEITTTQFFDKLGQRLAQNIQEYLTKLRNPANHPYTLEQKSPKTNPLIDTGELRQKITYKVE